MTTTDQRDNPHLAYPPAEPNSGYITPRMWEIIDRSPWLQRLMLTPEQAQDRVRQMLQASLEPKSPEAA